MPLTEKKAREPKVVSGEGYCRMCGCIKPASAFYDTTNPAIDVNGLMSICRDHCNEIYNRYFSVNKDLEKSIYLACEDLDVRFSLDALNATKTHIESALSNGKEITAVFGVYKSKLGSTSKKNGGTTEFRFKYSDKINYENNIDDIDLANSDLDEGIIKYWGKGKEVWEYEYLENELYRLKTDFECPDYGMEMIMRDICFINLDIERIRQNLDRGDITKLIESRSKLMNDGNLKPVQATGADKNEKMSLGVFIKKWENERPISKTLDDEMKTYIDTFMVGHLAKMEGLNNEAVKKYEEAIKEYTINFSDIHHYEEEE